MLVSRFSRVRRMRQAIIAGLAIAVSASAALPKQAQAADVIVTIHRVQAVSTIDYGSAPDFFAKVSIAGTTQQSRPIKQQNDIRPNWTFSKTVSSGKHDVTIEIWDKDIALNDLIDVNRVANRRPLSVTINTNNCAITNISGGHSCGDRIVRAGKERKSAEVTFSVKVR